MCLIPLAGKYGYFQVLSLFGGTIESAASLHTSGLSKCLGFADF
jgi:hypothetical protein